MSDQRDYTRVLGWPLSLGLIRKESPYHYFGLVAHHTVASRHRRDRMLRFTDVAVTGSAPHRRVSLSLRESKTDPRGNGCTILIHEIEAGSCPVKAVLRYLKMRPGSGEAFFCSYGSLPLTRHEFSAMIKRCMSHGDMLAAKFSSHSLRIGAATTAPMAGCSDAQIQHMGRWASSAHRRYIDMVV